MPTKTGTQKQVKGKAKANELVIERVFDAPRERVWKAWTEPEQAKRWWGPKGFTAPVWRTDFRVGGKYLYCMRSPDGKDYWGTGVYREIVRLEKIVATDSFADAEGKVVPATHYGFREDFPRELLLTVTFEDLGGKTNMTLRHAGFPAGPDRDGAMQGWTESFEKLGRKTRLTVASQFDSLEALEGMVGSGMEDGARETWDRLEELLAKA